MWVGVVEVYLRQDPSCNGACMPRLYAESTSEEECKRPLLVVAIMQGISGWDVARRGQGA